MEFLEFVKNKIIDYDNRLKITPEFADVTYTGEDVCPMRQLILLLRFIERCKLPVICIGDTDLEVLNYNNEFKKHLEFLQMCRKSFKIIVVKNNSIMSSSQNFYFKEYFGFDYSTTTFFSRHKTHKLFEEIIEKIEPVNLFDAPKSIIVYDKKTPNSQVLCLFPNKTVLKHRNFYINESDFS